MERAKTTEAAEPNGASAAEQLPELKAKIADLELLVQQLKHNVEVYRKLAFGPSSEKRRSEDPDTAGPPEQGHLFFSDLVAEAKDTAERNGTDTTITPGPPPKPRKQRSRRSKFPDHVPSVTTRCELPEDKRVCGCGSLMNEMGVETKRQLERIELTFVQVIERMKYGCRCGEHGVLTAPGPDRPFKKTLLRPSFLSYLINERFGNHMPYYRIEKKHAKEGLDVSRSVMQRSVALDADEQRIAPDSDRHLHPSGDRCESLPGPDLLH